MLPFWTSIALLSLTQGVLVAAPRALSTTRLAFLSGRRWAIIPPASVIVFVFVVRAAEHAGAEGLSYLALCAVPVLAALALGWFSERARPLNALLVLPLFVLAWVDRGALPGQAAALALSALSCVTLGVLIAAVTPARWLGAGIVAMAVADTVLVVSEELQRPNSALNAAHPVAGLPRLQSAVLGSAAMGYGDLFVAAALGGLLAVTVSRSLQLRAAMLTALVALGFDLLFLFVNELPATVPVALTLLILLAWRRRRPALSSEPPGVPPPGVREHGSQGWAQPPAPPARHPAAR
jgi:hypothetical protein